MSPETAVKVFGYAVKQLRLLDFDNIRILHCKGLHNIGVQCLLIMHIGYHVLWCRPALAYSCFLYKFPLGVYDHLGHRTIILLHRGVDRNCKGCSGAGEMLCLAFLVCVYVCSLREVNRLNDLVQI
ncbi:hypothetical protein KM043_008018 [Ampulex compressa]|nr:hypothetical protein KM043_008018 [Ampulex compressa]